MTKEVKPAYMGEALLLRWGDTASSGRTVTLQISEDDTSHPFKGFKCGQNGQRMEIVCVLKNDDEAPMDPDHARRSVATKPAQGSAGRDDVTPRAVPERAEPAAPVVKAETKRSSRAFLMCQDPEFQLWMSRHHPTDWTAAAGLHNEGSAICEQALKWVLGVVAKRELDSDPEAAARFDALRTSFELRGLVR